MVDVIETEADLAHTMTDVVAEAAMDTDLDRHVEVDRLILVNAIATTVGVRCARAARHVQPLS